MKWQDLKRLGWVGVGGQSILPRETRETMQHENEVNFALRILTRRAINNKGPTILHRSDTGQNGWVRWKKMAVMEKVQGTKLTYWGDVR